MQVFPVVTPQEPSGLDSRVDKGALEDVFAGIDIIFEVLDVLDIVDKVGLELQAPYPT